MQGHWLRFLFLAAPAVILPGALRAAPPAATAAESLPEQARDGAAATVTAENLLASERFWPYQVALAQPWPRVGGGKPVQPGVLGVLIRVEASGSARIDFGRHGIYEVPVAATDLLERANRIRRGELSKMAPNFVLAIGTRLADPSGPTLRPLGLRAAGAHGTFLAVFADPSAKDFPALAQALAPLRERDGVLTILFPQGEHPDTELSERLRALGWAVPFVYDHLAEAYTRSLLPEATPVPFVLLQTPEGRVLFQGRYGARLPAELAAALDRFSPAAAGADAGSRAGAPPARRAQPTEADDAVDSNTVDSNRKEGPSS